MNSTDYLTTLARRGAVIRLAELKEEQAQIEAFLGTPTPPVHNGARREVRAHVVADVAHDTGAPPAKRRLSAAARKSISLRMKARWRKWRKERAKES